MASLPSKHMLCTKLRAEHGRVREPVSFLTCMVYCALEADFLRALEDL